MAMVLPAVSTVRLATASPGVHCTTGGVQLCRAASTTAPCISGTHLLCRHSLRSTPRSRSRFPGLLGGRWPALHPAAQASRASSKESPSHVPSPVNMVLATQACVHAFAAVAPARQAGRSAVAVPSALPRRRRQLRLATQASANAAGAAATSAKRAFNFSAGPACLPLDVLQTAQAELVDWHGSGMSVLEMSHRGPEFEGIIAKAEKDLRTLMKIPDNYKARADATQPSHPRATALSARRSSFCCARASCTAAALLTLLHSPRRARATVKADAAGASPCAVQVLFVQGGASTQFAALPLNFAPEGATVDYVVTGAWGAKCVDRPAAAAARGLGLCC